MEYRVWFLEYGVRHRGMEDGVWNMGIRTMGYGPSLALPGRYRVGDVFAPLGSVAGEQWLLHPGVGWVLSRV